MGTAFRLLLLSGLTACLGLAGCDRLRNVSDLEHVERAKAFQAKGELRAAEIELKNAVAKNPKNGEARWQLGLLYLTQRRGSDAEKELRQAQTLGMNPAAVKVPLGRAYLLQGDADRLLREIAPDTQDSAAHTARILALRADALVFARRFRDGCAAYAEAQAADPDHAVEARWGLALCATARGDLGAAEALLRQAQTIDPGNDGTWARLGEFEQLRGDAKAAAAAFDEALKLNPLNVEALTGRAALHIAAGRLDAAEKDLRSLQTGGIEHPGLLHMTAALKQARRQMNAALDVAQRLEKLYPRYFPGWLLLAQLYHGRGNLNLAEQYVSRYLAVQPADRMAALLKADILARTGRAAEIPPLTEPLLARFPQDARLLAVTGQAYLAQGDFRRARTYLEQALAADPGNAGTRARLGRVWLAAGDTDKGLALLEEASSADGKSIEADLILVAEYNRLHQYDRALKAIATIERKQPNSALPHRLRAGVYLLEDDREAARQALEQGLRAEPKDLLTATALADLDLAQGQADAARERFRRMLEKDPANTDLMVALAQVAARAQDEQGFVDWLGRAVRAEAKALRPRRLLAEYYLAKGRSDQALALANEAAKANPDDPEALAFLGQMQFASGARENAVASFSRLVDMLPDPTGALVELARAQIALRRYGDARASLAQALEKAPDFPPALKVAGDLELLDGSPAKALAYADKLVGRAPASPTGYVLRGDARMRQRQYGAAVAAYEEALARDARDGAHVIRLHQALLMAGRASEADQRLKGWLDAHPAADAVLSYAAENAVQRRRWEVARDAYEKLLARHPGRLSVLNNLALVYLELADARAVATAERAWKQAPDNPYVMDTLGWALTRTGNAEKGRSLLAQAVAKQGDEPSLRYHYAVALAQTGDRLGAARELDAVLRGGRPFPELEQARALRRRL